MSKTVPERQVAVLQKGRTPVAIHSLVLTLAQTRGKQVRGGPTERGRDPAEL